MEQEGVIKYSLAFKFQAFSVDPKLLRNINHCRSLMIDNDLLGQDKSRYSGYGFGNISSRSNLIASEFFITGTQTGQELLLSNANISCITGLNIEQNTLYAYGEIAPSSESMTHGVLYQNNSQIQAVVHVHSPDIWRACDALQLASTAKEIPYGTPEMAYAVQELASALLINKTSLPILFVMKGHEDGVVAVGESLSQCSEIILETLQRAKQWSNSLSE